TVVSNKLVPAKTTIAAVSKPIAKPVAKPVTPVKVIPVKTAIPTATPIAGVQLVKKAAGKTTNSQVATPLGSPGPVGLTPAQVRHAYGLDSVSFNGIVGDGTGQTIAIVDAFDNPKFVSSTDPNYATSDLAIFSTAMGLPNPPSFTKLDQNGGTNYPTTTNAAWAAEVALNVEWAHAMAPMANIVLVEAKSANYADLLSAAANTARNLPGVSVVSMSFGTDGGFFNENVYDQYFTTPAGHQGVTFVAASGDHGAVLASGGTTYTGSYPAESPNVVAVGGTSLTLNAGEYASESGWTGSGGGISKFESKPAYQTGLTQSATQRTIPDVSITADPNSGVAVYDSFNNPDAGAGWYGNNFGGTSIAAPMWAGLLAVTNQARVANGLGTLNGSTQTLPRLYQVSQSNFHDITTGNNKADGVHGYLAGAGYDLVTGRGTPIANLLVPALVGGTSSGMAYIDKNSDGVFNNTDVKLVGGIIYADGNNNGIYDAGEITAITDANGLFTLDAPAGFPIRQGTPGYTDLSTNNPIGTTTNGVISGLVVPVFPTTYTNSGAGTRSITLRPLTQSSATQITLTNVVNGVTSNDFYTIATSRLPRLDFVSAGNTTLTIELTFGNGLLATTNTYTGAAGDVVLVKAATSGGAATFANTGITLGTKTMSFIGTNPDLSYLGTTAVDALTISGVTSGITFVGGGGVSVDAVNVTSGTPSLKTDLGGDGTKVNFTASGGTTTLIGPQHLNGVTLQNAAVANLRRPATTAVVLRTPSISINSAGGAALNLENNALILDYTTSSPNAAVAAWLASGYAAGAWTGGGIRSSTAAADATKLRGVGSNEASTALNLSGSATTSYLGETVDATTLLIRSTLAGDADLSGAVDFNDFLVLQNNFGQPGGTYAQADFNYDGVDDFNDFLMLQNGFNQIA
ncbi:MAG: peptidase in kexin sedolisin, partial [Phycisphaerales bacterium]|nr:peptidase in kexin sedolisin [Phycisphaerales bacterium]